MDASLVTPLVKLLQKMTTASVMTATSQFCQEPKSAAPRRRHVFDGGRIEGEADRKDHRAGDHGRKEDPQLLDENAEEDRDAAAHDLRAQDDAEVVVAVGEREQRRDIGEADAHDDRQLRADAPQPEHLHERRDGRNEQRHLDKQRLVRHLQPHGVGDEDRGGDDADDRGDHMLQAERDDLFHRRHAGHLEYGTCGSFHFIHHNTP